MGIDCFVPTSSITLHGGGRHVVPGPLLLSPFAKSCRSKTGMTKIAFVFARIPIPKLLKRGSSRLRRRVLPAAEPMEQCWGCVQEITKR